MDKGKINFLVDALMFLCMAALAGIGFLMKYVLIPGKEAWAVYGAKKLSCPGWVSTGMTGAQCICTWPSCSWASCCFISCYIGSRLSVCFINASPRRTSGPKLLSYS
jgi:hypothetical protein